MQFITNFGEEVVRGMPLFSLSLLLQHLDPQLRSAGGVSPWHVVSQPAEGGAAATTGRLVSVPSLADVQGASYSEPTIIVSEQVGGLEDIPPGVTAVLTRSSLDVLSHVAIRARSQGVLLVSCCDAAAWGKLAGLSAGDSAYVTVTLDASDNVVAGAASPAAAIAAAAGKAAAGGGGAALLPKLQLPRPAGTDAWALPEARFGAGLVGAKSGNLKKLRSMLPAGVRAPASVTLPFGTFERVLGDPANGGAAQQLRALQARLPSPGGDLSSAAGTLESIRELVATQLKAPAALVQAAATTAAAEGLIASAGAWTNGGSAEWAQVWSAVCRVWASKWTQRAWLSRQARSVPDDALFMAALLQQVVPARYAFVLHTANPVTGARGELFGEVVVGMGETLVGSHPGRALSFRSPQGQQQPQLLSLPSKRLALLAPVAAGGTPTLISRSDANGEDLEEFAGAGLYDSVPVEPLVEEFVDYASEPLFNDAGFRGSLMSRLAQLGRDVEKAMGGAPQDVEGVVTADGQLYVVQCRPQVL